MHPKLVPLGEQFVAYLSKQWQTPVSLNNMEQIPGGASRETYRINVEVNGTSEGLILRRDPVSSLIDTERALEYQTYQAIWETDIPVPEPLILEEDTQHLDRPFSVMREIAGCETSIPNPNQPPEAYESIREKLGHNKWSLLGKLASLDIEALGVTRFMDKPTHPARNELDYWRKVIETDAQHPQPVAAAAIRWLEKHLPPASEKLALVHGDYRTGNFLYDADAQVRGVLDWEMAHIGDPYEDLAWSLDPLWSWPDKDLAGSLLPREQAIEIWEASSGLKVDREIFKWWQVFASLKGLAIWISSTEDFMNGETKEPILAMAGWLMTDRENRILMDRLSPESSNNYAEPLV